MPEWANRLLGVARPLQWLLAAAWVVLALLHARSVEIIAAAGLGLVVVARTAVAIGFAERWRRQMRDRK